MIAGFISHSRISPRFNFMSPVKQRYIGVLAASLMLCIGFAPKRSRPRRCTEKAALGWSKSGGLRDGAAADISIFRISTEIFYLWGPEITI
jgi:hypothetical protein